MSKKMSPEQAFAEIKKHCMSKPGATEDYPWGDVAWKVNGKGFAFGGEGSNRLTVKSTIEKQGALTMHPNIEKAAYVGRFGWITIMVVDKEVLGLTKDLIDESYDMVVGSKRKRASR